MPENCPVHIMPMSREQDDLSHEYGIDHDFSWLTRSFSNSDCPLCGDGCCIQKVFGDMLTTPGVVLHGVSGAA